jgi:DNA-binding transcriptional MerR regulator
MNKFGKNLWQIKDFAKRAKVTIRTLHYYDRIGLLKPNFYNNKGFRFYGEAEFARLQQITTLKFIGFSLKQIKEILKDQNSDLAETLQLQKKVIKERRKQLDLALEAIAQAEKVFADSGETNWESFNKIIEVINMKQDMEWIKKYYSESALKKIETLEEKWSPELQERVSKDWKELYKDIESAISEGVKPTEEKAQKLANRWNSLITEFTEGDKEIREGLNKLYADEENWQTEWNKPFNDNVRNFIDEVLKANQ